MPLVLTLDILQGGKVMNIGQVVVSEVPRTNKDGKPIPSYPGELLQFKVLYLMGKDARFEGTIQAMNPERGSYHLAYEAMKLVAEGLDAAIKRDEELAASPDSKPCNFKIPVEGAHYLLNCGAPSVSGERCKDHAD